jgi:hypothetical protein
MSRFTKIITVASLALLIAIPALGQVRFGGFFAGPRVVIGPAYYGPAYYGYGYGYGYYGPYNYYPGYGYAPRPSMGNVKIDTKIKNGMIYVDGGYAGETGKLKKFPLTTGNHDIELRDSASHTVLKERVQVIPGRTVEIKPVS